MAYDYRSATGRADMPPKKLPRTGCAVIVAIIVTALFVGIALLGLRDKTPPETTRHMTPMDVTYTETGDRIGVYVVVDPDTQAQYVVSDHGGVTPRLDRYGVPMGTVAEDTTTYD